MPRNPVPTDAPVAAPRPPRSLGRALLVEARPKQWMKNLLVFAAPGAAGVIDHPKPFFQTLGAFACFCLAAAGTYYLNDAADVEADRLHPTKRFRPIAAGEIPLPLARALGAAGILGSVAAAFAVNWHLAVVVAAYVITTTAYSIWLKHLAVLDVVGVAAGFVLRAVAGGAAVDVPISNWFFIVASFGSLFMVVGKRRAEADELGAEAAATRATLGMYSRDYLIQLQTISSSVVMVGYCLWAFEKAAESSASVPWFQLSIVPFALAVLRYALLVDTGHGGAPEEVVLGDRSIQLMVLAWAVAFALGIYVT
ncbi:decaprenyl-phosphate phosphoribosyltransferase [Aquihabitans sp. G128]|uniref:decaprenyl-phosphate phosphoribosyltransferase n=1 Tax=Aquihabitans sp. G128 TaxID=2849779 RepID=UPI001C21E1D5|nr:decaprenyl-phosphate phosphoribosyltransferase [Aquihabitans sp. G128]QXC61328.1 decaprenyl-phosphate phosphoribosyltransferase [Aquihabitans sp. G128]